MKKVQEKAQDKKIDLANLTTYFKSTANAYILFYKMQSAQKRLNLEDAEKTAENFAGIKKGKYAHDMILCLLIKAYASKGEPKSFEKALELFGKIKCSNTAMTIKDSSFSNIYHSAFRCLLEAYKNNNKYVDCNRQKQNEMIMSKMTDEQIQIFDKAMYPRNMKNINLLRGQRYGNSLEVPIEKGDFKSIKKIINQAEVTSIKTELAVAVINKFSEIYMVSKNEEDKITLKRALTEIINIGKLSEEEKAGYLVMFKE